MEIALLLTIIGVLISFIWNLINSIQNYRQDKRYKIINLKLPLKKRLFNECYEFAKDISERMEFIETQKQEGHTTYKFRIKNKDGTGYLDKSEQKLLMYRFANMREELYEVCDYKKSKFKENFRIKDMMDTLGDSDFTFLNDKLPQSYDDIKKDFLERIKIDAKENGIKLK